MVHPYLVVLCLLGLSLSRAADVDIPCDIVQRCQSRVGHAESKGFYLDMFCGGDASPAVHPSAEAFAAMPCADASAHLTSLSISQLSRALRFCDASCDSPFSQDKCSVYDVRAVADERRLNSDDAETFYSHDSSNADGTDTYTERAGAFLDSVDAADRRLGADELPAQHQLHADGDSRELRGWNEPATYAFTSFTARRRRGSSGTFGAVFHAAFSRFSRAARSRRRAFGNSRRRSARRRFSNARRRFSNARRRRRRFSNSR